MCSTCGRSAHGGATPGRIVARTTSGRTAELLTRSSTIPALDGSTQWTSSTTTTRGPSVVEKPVDVAASATSPRISAVSAGSSGMSLDSISHPEKAASRAIGRDGATEPVRRRLVDVASRTADVARKLPNRRHAPPLPPVRRRGRTCTARSGHTRRSRSRSRRSRTGAPQARARRAAATCPSRSRRSRGRSSHSRSGCVRSSALRNLLISGARPTRGPCVGTRRVAVGLSPNSPASA